ncbi:MAG: 50S ribosomal protein L9 [Candidatus Eiseniibacteriota bacterium]|nr:MAG: 50S ribosomal protein L9 [Candidatus Eisenbacteria bacterium]
MEVILLEDIEGLGKRGETVKVAKGHARNFLLPLRKAVPSKGAGARVFEEEERRRHAAENKMRRAAEQMAAELANVSCTIAVKAGEDDKLFGAVTAADIAELLEKQGVQIDKRKIVLEEPLKSLGVYTVTIKLFQDIQADIKVWVVSE